MGVLLTYQLAVDVFSQTLQTYLLDLNLAR